ncbi:MAG: hypothetical protein ACYC3O_03290 [Burkholderiales bacterium]
MDAENILTTIFKDELERAKNGDKLAARDALFILSSLLSKRNCDSAGKRHPIPEYVLDYISDALESMARGQSGDRAFHLKKPGNQAWGQFEKRLAVHIVSQLVEQGISVLDACGIASDEIQTHITQKPCPPAWRGFKGRAVSSETLQAWYYEIRFMKHTPD